MDKGSKGKNRIITGAAIIAAILVMLLTSYAEYRIYTNNYNKSLNAICTRLVEKYPDIEKAELIELLNDKNEATDFFAGYGIDMDKETVILENDRAFKGLILINIAIMAGGFLLWGTYRAIKNKRIRKSLERIAIYLKSINEGNYLFDMDSSSEGELAILESEIFKTTIMLKEAANTSRLDKENLKDALSDISHQLKTPITSLMINLENLEGLTEPDAGVSKRLIANAKRDATRVSVMVQQLLTLSRLDANVIEFKKDSVVLSDIADEALANVEALAELREISLQKQAEEAAQVSIVCDFYWEVQAVTNILKNAIEHAKSRVSVGFSDCGMYREIIIENDGDTISDTDKKNIFKRFYSGGNSTKDSIGIGLSLANAVVKQDGGYIVVESDSEKEDSGARFTIRYF